MSRQADLELLSRTDIITSAVQTTKSDTLLSDTLLLSITSLKTHAQEPMRWKNFSMRYLPGPFKASPISKRVFFAMY